MQYYWRFCSFAVSLFITIFHYNIIEVFFNISIFNISLQYYWSFFCSFEVIATLLKCNGKPLAKIILSRLIIILFKCSFTLLIYIFKTIYGRLLAILNSLKIMIIFSITIRAYRCVTYPFNLFPSTSIL